MWPLNLRDLANRIRQLPSHGPVLNLCRTDPDAINIPFGAKTQCRRILTWLAAGQVMSAWTLITQLKATSGASRGREVRKWLRANGFTVVQRYKTAESGARVLLWSLAAQDRPRLRAMLKQSMES